MASCSISIVTFLNLFIFFLLKADGRTANLRSQDSDFNQKLPSRSAIKVIRSSNGDVFDCMDLYKQPAFDHPLLKDHKLQLRPTSYPEDLSEGNTTESIHEDSGLENVPCPEGSVPILRAHGGDLKMKLNDTPFFEDRPNQPEVPTGQEFIVPVWAVENTHVHTYYGAAADLNIYPLPQVKGNQLSATAIWITNRVDPNVYKFPIISVGWQVYPGLYGDSKTRLFARWTTDNHQSTGCYDVQCPGFVATSKSITLGIRVAPLSTYGGKQYIIRPIVYKDKVSGNWWLAYGRYSNVIGYWPKEIFHDFDAAKVILYGGLVGYAFNETRPPMGNGHFPQEPNHKSCTISRVKIIDETSTVKPLAGGDRFEVVKMPRCYDAGPYDGNHHFFHFGGNGIC